MSVRAAIVIRNSALNLLTQGILLCLAFWGLPIIAGGLGPSNFGVLTLLWAIVGYFSLFDLGTGRAVTKAVAEGIGSGDLTRAKRALWAGLGLSVVLGVGTSLLLIVLIPLGTGLFPDLGKDQVAMVSNAFLIASIGIPWMLVHGTVSGTLMAFQRFAIVNLLRGSLGILQWVGSALLIWSGKGFVEIIGLTVAARILTAIAGLFILRATIPGCFRGLRMWDRKEMTRLVSFGGWVTISQVLGPVFLFADRFLIASLVSASAVAFYALPQEALLRLSVIPLSLSMTLFPALSQEPTASNRRSERGTLYSRSLRHLFDALLPLVAFLILFAREILDLWVGPSYAENSTLVFQILCAGFLFNALAQLPMAALHAIGKPDIPAKLHSMELPVTLAVNVLLLPVLGPVIVAIVWTVRVVVDSILLGVAFHIHRRPPFYLQKMILTLLAAGVIVPALLGVESASSRLGAFAILFLGYAAAVWRFSFDPSDRRRLQQLLGFGRSAESATKHVVDDADPEESTRP